MIYKRNNPGSEAGEKKRGLLCVRGNIGSAGFASGCCISLSAPDIVVLAIMVAHMLQITTTFGVYCAAPYLYVAKKVKQSKSNIKERTVNMVVQVLRRVATFAGDPPRHFQL